MRKHKIIIDNFKCPSWNTFNRSVHWAVRAGKRDEIQKLVKCYVFDQVDDMEPFGKKVNIRYECFFRDKGIRHDHDNMFVKPITDAIVKTGLIRDDGWRDIHDLTIHVKGSQDENKIVIWIFETVFELE